MNAIEQKIEIDRLNDRVNSPRFPDEQYFAAINQAIEMILNDRIDNIKNPKKYSLQSVQRIREELYTLIKNSAVMPVANVLAFPIDYRYYLYLECTIDGVVQYFKPTTYNEIGPLQINPFRKPKPRTPYFNEVSTGLKLLCGAGVITTSSFDYLKTPNKVSIGYENNKILAAGTLVAATTYYVFEEAVYSGTTYYEGQTITGTGAVLTSGVVIPTSVVVNCDLPNHLQPEINRMASAIMQGTIEDYMKKQQLELDNLKS
jgi:hypothetical protein